MGNLETLVENVTAFDNYRHALLVKFYYNFQCIINTILLSIMIQITMLTEERIFFGEDLRIVREQILFFL